MREQDPRVPPEVEQYFIDLFSRAGDLGDVTGGGARGGARGAKRLKTVVEDRIIARPAAPEDVQAQLSEKYPKAQRLSAPNDVLRMAIPIGMTGIQKIVVDVSRTDGEHGGSPGILVRAYGKEGLLSRKPTTRTADEIAEILAS